MRDAGEVWLAYEDCAAAALKVGDEVDVGEGPEQARIVARAGPRAIVKAGGSQLFVKRAALSDKSAFLAMWRSDDVRILPVKQARGVRSRTWAELAADIAEEPVADFPVKAPRTAAWCAQYLIKTGGPSQHHECWRSRRRLGATDVGVDMHETLCRMAEHMGTCDQYDLANSASAELLFRKLQLIEHFYDERDVDQAMQANSKVPPEEMRAFVGGGRPASMVSPDLLEHVSRELERIASIKKNSRKLREENAAGKKGGRGGPPKGQ